MQNIAEVVEGKKLLEISSHPDDSINHGHIHELDVEVSVALLSLGEAGKNLRTGEPDFDVSNGDRVEEEAAAAPELGITEVLSGYGGEDGNLRAGVSWLASMVARDAIEKGADFLVSVGGLTDHDDHLVSGFVAQRAAQLLLEKGHEVDVLDLQLDGSGDLKAVATDGSMARIFRAARHHRSQWRIQDSPQSKWERIPGGLFMHPDDFESLAIYPLLRDATYKHTPAERIALHPEELELVAV